MLKSVTEYQHHSGTSYYLEYDNGTVKHYATAKDLSHEELYCWRFLRLVGEYRFLNCIKRQYIAE